MYRRTSPCAKKTGPIVRKRCAMAVVVRFPPATVVHRRGGSRPRRRAPGAEGVGEGAFQRARGKAPQDVRMKGYLLDTGIMGGFRRAEGREAPGTVAVPGASRP